MNFTYNLMPHITCTCAFCVCSNSSWIFLDGSRKARCPSFSFSPCSGHGPSNSMTQRIGDPQTLTGKTLNSGIRHWRFGITAFFRFFKLPRKITRKLFACVRCFQTVCDCEKNTLSPLRPGSDAVLHMSRAECEVRRLNQFETARFNSDRLSRE